MSELQSRKGNTKATGRDQESVIYAARLAHKKAYQKTYQKAYQKANKAMLRLYQYQYREANKLAEPIPQQDGTTTRKQALEMGLKKYFTGKHCINGHLTERSINGGCLGCIKDRSLTGYFKKKSKG